MQLLFVGLGGFLGAVGRWLVSRFINAIIPVDLLPWGTLGVNIIGSFLLAWVMSASYSRMQMPPAFLLFIGTGFWGAFTTFSTFSYETVTLFSHSPLRGALNIGVMMIATLSAAAMGYYLGKS